MNFGDVGRSWRSSAFAINCYRYDLQRKLSIPVLLNDVNTHRGPGLPPGVVATSSSHSSFCLEFDCKIETTIARVNAD